MQKTNNPNINTRTYWNQVYGTPQKRAQYAAQGTDKPITTPDGMHHAAVKTNRFTKTLEYIKPYDAVLDIGCGVGVFTRLVKETYPMAEVWGTDISDQAIADNRKEHPDIQYRTARVGYQDGVPQDHFDVVFSGETLEHLDEPSDLFRDAYKALKKGGLFILTTPVEDRIRSEEHTWTFTHEDIEQLYQDNGFAWPAFVYLPNMEHLLVIYAVGRKL